MLNSAKHVILCHANMTISWSDNHHPHVRSAIHPSKEKPRTMTWWWASLRDVRGCAFILYGEVFLAEADAEGGCSKDPIGGKGVVGDTGYARYYGGLCYNTFSSRRPTLILTSRMPCPPFPRPIVRTTWPEMTKE